MRHAGRSIWGSGRSFVTVMQSANHWDADHTTLDRRFDGPRDRRVVFQRQVTSGIVVVVEVRHQNAAQMILVPHDEMVEALSADGPD